jgi:hypothetical protein
MSGGAVWVPVQPGFCYDHRHAVLASCKTRVARGLNSFARVRDLGSIKLDDSMERQTKA